ncbi:hypothetical protein GQR58_022071 [Nymphon striatum]|nr:hypothetical protein GQR58_022071 [Nymphon striatum]
MAEEESEISSDSIDISSDLSDFFDDDNLTEPEEVDKTPKFGVLPYQFEPEYDEAEAVPEANIVQVDGLGDNDSRRLVDLKFWCTCGHCQLMDTEKECRCCQEITEVEQKLRDPAIDNANFQCIITHPGFDGACLNIWALQVALLAYKQDHGNLPVNGPNHVNSDNSDVDNEPMESDNETIDSYECDDVDLSEHEDDGVMLSDSWKRIADIFSDCRPNSLPELVLNLSGVNPALNCNTNNSVLDCFKKFITNDVIDYLVKKYRHLAYRQFVRWCWGFLGKKIRVVIPSCAVTAIRNAFQSDTYKGFKLPNVD